MRVEVGTARVIYCAVYKDVAIKYKGYGRPPKYCEKARKEIQAKRRRDRYEAQKKAQGKAARRNKARKAKSTKH